MIMRYCRCCYRRHEKGVTDITDLNSFSRHVTSSSPFSIYLSLFRSFDNHVYSVHLMDDYIRKNNDYQVPGKMKCIAN